LANQELTDLIASNLFHLGSLFGLPEIEGTRDIREEIANVVAEMVVKKTRRNRSNIYDKFLNA
jgi:hypothetical protein